MLLKMCGHGALLGSIHFTLPIRNVWQPPLQSVSKLNFDATIFTDLNCFGFGAIIQNDRGEVMAAMSVKGPPVTNSEEVEALACRKALEFSIDAGFSELIIEGDNANVMRAISSSLPNHSLLGHIIEDVKCLMCGLQYASANSIRREGNKVAHVLARHVKNTLDDMYWLKDSPPSVVNALYQDFILMNESMLVWP